MLVVHTVEMEIGIGDWRLGIGDWDWGLGIGIGIGEEKGEHWEEYVSNSKSPHHDLPPISIPKKNMNPSGSLIALIAWIA
jgi:hypothetical protein